MNEKQNLQEYLDEIEENVNLLNLNPINPQEKAAIEQILKILKNK